MITAKQLREIQKELDADKSGLAYDMLQTMIESTSNQAMMDDLSADDVKMLEEAGYKVILAQEETDEMANEYEVSW